MRNGDKGKRVYSDKGTVRQINSKWKRESAQGTDDNGTRDQEHGTKDK